LSHCVHIIITSLTLHRNKAFNKNMDNRITVSLIIVSLHGSYIHHDSHNQFMYANKSTNNIYASDHVYYF